MPTSLSYYRYFIICTRYFLFLCDKIIMYIVVWVLQQ